MYSAIAAGIAAREVSVIALPLPRVAASLPPALNLIRKIRCLHKNRY
jgi:hypothetical protein